MDMDATSNNITSEDSILVSLNKTRELWSSKADVSLATAKVPKPQMVKPGSRSSSSNSDIRSNERPADVVSSDDLVVEDFELPDIRGIKSQWETVESPNKEVGVPMPFAKSPAEVARERERSARRQKMQEKIVEAPEQQQDETYRIELGKLKAQFESKSSAQTSNKPLSPQRTSSFKRSALKDTNKFKDKVDVMEVPAATNGYHNEVCEEASVDLASIKSQFESRKDEMPLSPARQVDKKPDSVPASVAPPNDQPEREIVRSSEPIADENYEVEMGALRKMFERKPAADISPQKPPHIAQIRKTPADIKTTKYTPTKETEAAVSEPVVTAIESGSTMNTPVKSSEPMHEEMIGEESVKDRLERFKAIASPNAPAPSPENHKRASRKSSVARKDSLASVSSEERQQQHQQEAEVVRSPPAGTPESIQRAPSLRETKALFQSQVDKSSELLSRRRSSSRDTSRSSSRRSSRSRSTTSSVSRRSQSPSSRRKASLSVGSDVADMTEVVQSSPAGVKEQVNVTPTLKVSAAKSVFEVKGKPSGDDGPAATPQPRRQLRTDWTSGGGSGGPKVVAEGTFEEKQGIVRPPSAGTKELPSYKLGTSLKSRAALFEGNSPTEYKPRNKIKSSNTPPNAEVVNAAGKSTEGEVIERSNNLLDAKKVFENGVQTTKTSKPTVDIVPASNLSSVKKIFDKSEEDAASTPAAPKDPIDIQKEAQEAIQRDVEIKETTESAAAFEVAVQPDEPEPEPESEPAAAAESESDTEGEYVLKQDNQQVEEELSQSDEVTASSDDVISSTDDLVTPSDDLTTPSDDTIVSNDDVIAPSDDVGVDDDVVESSEVISENEIAPVEEIVVNGEVPTAGEDVPSTPVADDPAEEASPSADASEDPLPASEDQSSES